MVTMIMMRFQALYVGRGRFNGASVSNLDKNKILFFLMSFLEFFRNHLNVNLCYLMMSTARSMQTITQVFAQNIFLICDSKCHSVVNVHPLITFSLCLI